MKGATQYQPSLGQRIWSWLGFGERYIARPEDTEGMAPGYLTTRTGVDVGWRDRIRTLISGRIQIVVYTQTDVTVTTAISRSGFSVLPPAKAQKP